MTKQKKNRAAVALGRLGGLAGRGESKVRGDAAHYAEIARKSWLGRQRKGGKL